MNSDMIHTDSQVTVLRSASVHHFRAKRLQKKFTRLPSGELQKTNFQLPILYSVAMAKVQGIEDLGRLIEEVSGDPYKVLIRGLPKKQMRHCRKSGDYFSEHPDGTPWAMLDFDDLTLPEGLDPLSVDAIDWAIQKLPAEFHGVTYYYQHSSSAGIMVNGRPLKKGLNAHVFFWLSRRVPGDVMTVHLKHHCLKTDFYRVGLDKGGSVRVWYGFDPALFQEVQAHYTAAPDIGEGVECRLAASDRQGFARKARDTVEVPALTTDLVRIAEGEHRRVVEDFQQRNGYVRQVSQTRNQNGIATTYRYVSPHASSQGGRTFLRATLNRAGEFATLYFEGESSPGSWFVAKGKHAHMAHKFGGDKMLLRELSPGAHAYVRDELRWFSEVPGHNLPLTEQGYLPAISSFANARVSLILAPTGSGKTKAVIDWTQRDPLHTCTYVYAAPTIALVNQMQADVEARTAWINHYRELPPGPISGGVIVTTNRSLPKILNRLYDQARPHCLIVDEIHVGLDEFLKRPKSLEFLESAMAKARKTLLLTGTLTDIQRNKVADVVCHALSSQAEADFCRYEFAPFKSNPVTVRDTMHFNSDFIQLLDQLKAKLDAGEPLPRVVLILATSKMEAYRTALAERGLTDQAQVVSRQESFEDEIEEARTGQQSILIASPLFAVGLNFEREADIFWCNFSHLPADKSQIIQTLNRANRGRNGCEVRIYGNPEPNAEFRLPPLDTLQPDVAERFRGESTLSGLLDSHFQVDLTAYKLLRDIEKDGHVALSQLVRDNAIQNFKVVRDEQRPVSNKAADAAFKLHKKAAQAGYLQAIETAAQRFSQDEIGELFMWFERLSDERMENWRNGQARLEKDMKNDELGLVRALCGVTPTQAKKVSVIKLKRLFAEAGPWMSAQYDRERFHEWAAVEADKTETLAVVLDWLARIRSGEGQPEAMSGALTRPGGLREGLLALSKDDVDFQKMFARLAELAEARRSVRDAGSALKKAAVRESGLALLADLLEPLGVVFAKSKVDNRTVPDYSKLKIPARWDLSAMKLTLLRRAQSLRNLPAGATTPCIEQDITEVCYSGTISISLCNRCVHLHQKSCMVGKDVDWLDEDGSMCMNPPTCDRFLEFRAAA